VTEIEASLGRSSKGGHRRTLEIGFLLVLPIFFGGLAPRAASQQTVSHSPANLDVAAVAESSEAEAHSPQRPSAQPSLGSIHGTVLGKDGSVYEGATVTLVQSGSGAPANATASDASGRFDFVAVPAGAFKVSVSSIGFATQSFSGVLHGGESVEAQPVVLLFASAASDVRVTATREEIAQEELKQEEQQRVFGIIPNFYVAYAPDAPPLTSRQKFQLAWRSSVDPITLLSTGFFAGMEQAQNDFSGYGQGAQGYAKRYAANYADNVIGTMMGAALFPALLKQDPRYFYKGTGTVRSRILYAAANAAMCKSDKGKWQPNYSGLGAGLISGGISNLYYPAANRNGVSLTFENFSLGLAESAVQNIFQEFVVRRLTPRLPHYGPQVP
jgi:hypothetical protein